MVSDADALKRNVAAAALAEVDSGMVLGLGTGSTAAIFVQLLGDALVAGSLRNIRGVCTSRATEALAREKKIPIVEFNSCDIIDLAVDGADEIDPRLRLIKGRGGALLREKIVEQSARRFIVIADATKQVQRLGVGVLPIEVVRFSSMNFLRWLERDGVRAAFRKNGGELFVTDEGHHIIDAEVPHGLDIAEFVERLRRRAGLVETGFFPDEATKALIATADGVVTMQRP